MKKFVVVAAVLAGVMAATYSYRAYLIHELRKPVLAKLSDPDSAQFKDEHYFGNWTTKDAILCGRINAKNMMGGYVGYRPFAAFETTAFIGDGDILDESTEAMCEVQGNPRPWWWLRF
jgi:hypothetical protein